MCNSKVSEEKYNKMVRRRIIAACATADLRDREDVRRPKRSA